jgi:hypothetical protein
MHSTHDRVIARILLAVIAARGWLLRLFPTHPQGATVAYAVELRALRDVEVSPELISDTEMDLAWGLLWHQFERGMQDEIDRVFAPLLAALPVAEDFDELRKQTCPKELMPA